jgi:hypothetical protein
MFFYKAGLPLKDLGDIAISAISGQEKYGAITGLAQEYGISRQKVYDIRDRAYSAIHSEFESYAYTPQGSFTLEITEEDIKRTVIAMRVIAPSSIRDEVALLPVIYGKGWSYGKIQGILVEAERRAGEILKKIDLGAIKNVALDEMFSQGRPVFGGIDLDTQYLFQLEVHPSRGGEDWDNALAKLRDNQNLNPLRAVKDAGTGLGKGVRSCWKGIEEHDDMFHAVKIMIREVYYLELRAYSAIREVYDLEFQQGQSRNRKKSHSIGQKIWRAKEKMDKAIELYDRFEFLCSEARRALELTDRGSGHLRTPEEVESILTRVSEGMNQLGISRIHKVARYIKNRASGLGKYLKDIGISLMEITEDAGGNDVVEAVIRFYQANLDAQRKGCFWEEQIREKELKDSLFNFLETTGNDHNQILKALNLVVPILEQRYRASSAIENLNSVLRPYLMVQKNVQQGFLNLFRFFWNMRKREWGKSRGSSPYEELTGNRVDDWLTLLGYPPSERFAAAA